MEKDTVILDIKTYNELRDFKKEIEANNTMVISSSMAISSSGLVGYPMLKTFISESTTVKEIAQENARLKEQIEELKNQKEPSIYELKRMSYWEFRKWRKS